MPTPRSLEQHAYRLPTADPATGAGRGASTVLRRTRHSLPRWCFALAIGSLGLAACGGGSDAATWATDAGAPVPAASGEPVLTITGDVGRPNTGADVALDLEGLEAIGTVQRGVFEPFLEVTLDVTGVPIERLFAAAGIDPDATVEMVALDDYVVTFRASELADERPLLATRVGGRPIAVSDGGPIRLVFPDADGPFGRDTNRWIWSIERMEVRR